MFAAATTLGGGFLVRRRDGVFISSMFDVTSAGSLRPQTESMQAGSGAGVVCFEVRCGGCPITTLSSQLAAAGRPFCVSTDILGHRTASVVTGGVGALQCRARGSVRCVCKRVSAGEGEEDHDRTSEGRLTGVFAAGQPVEDEARSREYCLGWSACILPANWAAVGLGVRWEACECTLQHPPRLPARRHILWRGGWEWHCGRAGESVRTSRLKQIPGIYTTNFSPSLLFLLFPEGMWKVSIQSDTVPVRQHVRHCWQAGPDLGPKSKSNRN